MGITQGLDVGKLKQLVTEHWRTGGMNTLVKVSPKGTTPNKAYNAGYCTTFKYVVGRTPSEMEDVVGIKQGSKFLQGADIFLVRPLPTAAQFELRGYTQLPGGVATNDPAYKAHPGYPPGLGAPQWDLNNYTQDQLQLLASVPAGQRFTYSVSKLPPPI